MKRINAVRSLFVLLILVSVVGTVQAVFENTAQSNRTSGDEVENLTVFSQQAKDSTVRNQETETSHGLLVVAPNGTIVGNFTYHGNYWDVDPVPGDSAMVLLTASDLEPGNKCDAGTTACMLNTVELLNIQTGEREVLYSRYNPIDRDEVGNGNSSRWHDVDRYNETHLIVADIYRNEVSLVNIESGEVDWRWQAEETYSRNSGGPYPADWTHMNDVERVRNGQIMVSLRNHDTVAFLEPGRGFVTELTLGSDNAHSVLYQQHNPDYISAERGGPAVVVADSENNRIIEYQRSGGEWVESWRWADDLLAWPRDADRLPNGHTLVTDSRGGRIIQVNREGEVVWELHTSNPYEAERLGTGDESEGGEAASELELENKRATGFRSYLPARVVNLVGFIAPSVLGIKGTIGAGAALALIICWSIGEGARARFL